MSQRIAERGIMTHMNETGCLTDLIIDCKLQVMGKEPRSPITMERLDECTRSVGKIQQCREKGLWK